MLKKIERIAVRTLIMAVLTIAAFLLMQPITIATGWPEVMQCMKAAAVLAWAEHSIMIIRITMQPRINVQDAAVVHTSDSRSLAIVYFAHQFTWAVRLAAFLALYGVL